MAEPCCPPLFEGAMTEDDAAQLAIVLRALADPARLRLLSIIAGSPGGEACACDLHDQVGRAQPTVSYHLAQLVRAGLLTRTQRGRWAWFRVADDQLEAVQQALTFR